MPITSRSPLGRLLSGPIRPGQIVWIGLRPRRYDPMIVPATALLQTEHGLDGDHYDTQRNGSRQVTLIASEDLLAMAAFLHVAQVSPESMRRNLVTRGVNLLALKDRRFRIGEAVLEGSGECQPCSRIELALGPGGFNAARGRGGITARVLQGGQVMVGDAIVVVDQDVG